jgi:hypothetical protein
MKYNAAVYMKLTKIKKKKQKNKKKKNIYVRKYRGRKEACCEKISPKGPLLL